MRFKEYLIEELLLEGGHATAKWGTRRVLKADIEDVIKLVSTALNIPIHTLKDSLLGSTVATLNGEKESSGDIDIVIVANDVRRDEIMKIMSKIVKGEVYWNAGGKIASYAIPVTGGKVQTDFMFVKTPDMIKWAKFVYKNDLGRKSVYNNLIRNELLTCVLHQKIVPGDDVLIKDDEGNILARASRSFKWDTGVERLFKSTTDRKDGKGRTKSMSNVTPEKLKKELTKIGVDMKFKEDPDVITDPDDFAVLLFGEKTKAKQIETVEALLKTMKEKLNDTEYKAAMKEAAKVLYKRQVKEKFDMPAEFEEYK